MQDSRLEEQRFRDLVLGSYASRSENPYKGSNVIPGVITAECGNGQHLIWIDESGQRTYQGLEVLAPQPPISYLKAAVPINVFWAKQDDQQTRYQERVLVNLPIDVRSLVIKGGGLVLPIQRKLSALGINALASPDLLARVFRFLVQGRQLQKEGGAQKYLNRLSQAHLSQYPYCSPTVEDFSRFYNLCDFYAKPELSLDCVSDPFGEIDSRKFNSYRRTTIEVPSETSPKKKLPEFVETKVSLGVLLRESGVRPLLRWYIQYSVLSLIESQYQRLQKHAFFKGMTSSRFAQLKNDLETTILAYRAGNVENDVGSERSAQHGYQSTYQSFCQSLVMAGCYDIQFLKRFRQRSGVWSKLKIVGTILFGYHPLRLAYDKLAKKISKQFEVIEFGVDTIVRERCKSLTGVGFALIRLALFAYCVCLGISLSPHFWHTFVHAGWFFSLPERGYDSWWGRLMPLAKRLQYVLHRTFSTKPLRSQPTCKGWRYGYYWLIEVIGICASAINFVLLQCFIFIALARFAGHTIMLAAEMCTIIAVFCADRLLALICLPSLTVRVLFEEYLNAEAYQSKIVRVGVHSINYGLMALGWLIMLGVGWACHQLDYMTLLSYCSYLPIGSALLSSAITLAFYLIPAVCVFANKIFIPVIKADCQQIAEVSHQFLVSCSNKAGGFTRSNGLGGFFPSQAIPSK
ncbi:MAG: hypothetical protein VXW87_05155 [Pseudomonadota bacterium]|nr:hypothetical protein [Pseudomonadota bacterium]